VELTLGKPSIKRGISGLSSLFITVNGRMAEIGWEQKLIKWGILFLGPEFADAVPALDLPEDRRDNRAAMHLRGYTQDRRLFSMWKRYSAWANGEGEKPFVEEA
jgi:hypothetical protein